MKNQHIGLVSIFLSIVLFFVFLLESFAMPVYAVDGEIGSDIHTQGMNELSVRLVINKYFSQRKDYLQGISDTIDIAVAPMVIDEEKHASMLSTNNVVMIESAVSIGDVSYNTTQADAVVTETAIFQSNEEQITEVIEHNIHLYLDNSGSIWVNGDGYIEEMCGFVSCSYVDPKMAHELNAGGSRLCIVEIAKTQIGEGEDSNRVTKYGTWFTGIVNNGTDYSATDWCAMFVYWCAYHSNISNTVIKDTSSVPIMALFFDSKGQYYQSKATNPNTTFTPRTGDLIFMEGSYDSPYHIGIVTSCSGGYVYYIDGNSTKNNGDVRSTSGAITAPFIVGYARPSYGSSSHVYSENWSWNNNYHWKECAHCEIATISKTAHTIIQDVSGREMCSVCLYGHSIIMKKDIEGTE